MLHRLSIFKSFLLVFTVVIDTYAFIAFYDLMKDKHSFHEPGSYVRFLLATILFLVSILNSTTV